MPHRHDVGISAGQQFACQIPPRRVEFIDKSQLLRSALAPELAFPRDGRVGVVSCLVADEPVDSISANEAGDGEWSMRRE